MFSYKLCSSGTMTDKLRYMLLDHINNKNEREFVVRFDDFPPNPLYLKAYPLVLKVVMKIEYSGKKFDELWVEDLGGYRLKVYSSYSSRSVHADDKILGLGGRYKLKDKDEYMYLPRGYTVVDNSYKLKSVKTMEPVSPQDIELLYTQLDAPCGPSERVYYKELKKNLFN